MITLRPLQSAGIADIRAAFKQGHKRVLYTAPPGAGKTLLAAYMVSTSARRGFPCLFICNRVELMEQTAAAFDALDIEYGLFGGGQSKNQSLPIQIASVDTLKRRNPFQPKLVIWDECRGIGADGWTKVFKSFPDAFHVGLDATPVRTDGRSLKDYFTRLIAGSLYSELQSLGILVPFNVFAPHVPDMAGIKTVRGEYDPSATEALMDKPSLTGDIAAHFKANAGTKQGLTFAVSRVHSEHLALQYRALGIWAQHVDGETERGKRKSIVDAFRRREIQVICNVALFTAGFDVPGIEIITDAAPTRSISIAVQRWGRGSRSEAGKVNCTLYDHAGNVFRHGFPDDDREWTLEDGEHRIKRSDAIPIRQCVHCYACSPINADHCRECGVVFPAKPREVEQRSGELIELEHRIAVRTRKREEGMAQTLDDWKRIARERGYKPGWAYFRYQMRLKRG